MRFRMIALVLGAVLLAGCGSDEKDEKKASASPSATPTVAASPTAEPAPGCERAEEPKAKDVKAKKPTITLDPAKTFIATVKTTCGDFDIELDVKRAPKTTASFVSLARANVYDDTTFLRNSPGLVIQGGDPTMTRAGGPGYQIVEAPPQDLRYAPGTVAMAKKATDPVGASESQFFVVTGDGGLSLPPEYALLGTLTGDVEAVQAIATAPTDPATEQPLSPIVIKTITIREK